MQLETSNFSAKFKSNYNMKAVIVAKKLVL